MSAGQAQQMATLLDEALLAAPALAAAKGERRDMFLHNFAAGLEARQDEVLATNADEVAQARARGLHEPLCDRLDLAGGNFAAMVASVRAVAALPDPIGAVFDTQRQASGITVGKMRVPLGVVCFIYESRPNVTADGAALCVKSGNTAVLRGGAEALATNQAIAAVAHDALRDAGLPAGALGMVPVTDRALMATLLADTRLDLVIPRGGQALVDHVQRTAAAPVLAHLYGNCHLYVDASADLDKATDVIANAKCQRSGTCNALESLVVHAAAAPRLLPRLAAALPGVELRACERALGPLGDTATAASAGDWRAEYLDLILSVKVVDDLATAIAWINTHGSHHSDGILTGDDAAAARFEREVDSASVLVNASTRFADGFMYGLGAETGISTGKLHARGPVGLHGLTSVKWIVRGDHSVRT